MRSLKRLKQLQVLKVAMLSFLTALTAGKLYAQQDQPVSGYQSSRTGGFIENRGQLYDQSGLATPGIKYLLRGPGMNVQLRSSGFSYDTYSIISNKSASKSAVRVKGKKDEEDSVIYRFHRVDIRFLNANPSPQVFSEVPFNYYFVCYTASNPRGTAINSFRYVKYKEIYPGIDVVFDAGSPEDLTGFEYYFIVKPGADVRQIKLSYNGAATGLDKDRIIIRTENGKMEETTPASFIDTVADPAPGQLRQGAPVKVVYKQYSEGVYGFKAPLYDKAKTLVIDPTPDLAWGTYYGGSINDWAYAIDRDPSGNILVGGASDNPNMATTGAYITTLKGFSDAMLGKFKADGTLLWMSYFGGEGMESVNGICSDNNGNVIITGTTTSKSGIASPGSYQSVHGDAGYGTDAFLAKFDPAGMRIWATYFGGSDADYLHAVRADKNGNLFVAGWTQSTNAIATPGAFQTTYASSSNPLDWSDGVLARFDNNGQRIWATYYGGVSFDRFYDLDLDNNGNLYAAGIAYSPGLATATAYQPALGGGIYDALLVKFNPNGQRLWASYYGGDNEDYAEAITCDKQDNVIIAGMTISTAGIGTPGTYLPAFAGGTRDGFVAKFNANGSRLWGTYYGGTGEEMILGITSDNNNNPIITGWTYSTNNIATAGSYQPNFSGTGAIWTPFVAKLNKDGGRSWGTYFGYGNMFGNGQGEDVVTDDAGNIFICGETMAPHGIATCNAVQKTWGGNQDMYVAMLSETVSSPIVSVTIAADKNAVCPGTPVTFTADVLNGGTNPLFQWQVNGTNTGSNSSTFTDNNLSNGDKVTCIVTSNLSCVTDPKASSNALIVSINPSIVPAVSITSSQTGNICLGATVTFTAVPVNGGNTPSYQWKINGNDVGTDNAIFITNTLSDGDMVTCELTNPSSCNAITTAIANPITVHVLATAIPAITIKASTLVACAGTPVTFTAQASQAGPNPGYQWKISNVDAGNGPTYTTSNLTGNETIECFLMPDHSACAVSAPVASNKLNVQIDPLPVFSIDPPRPLISRGDTMQLKVIGSNILQYQWVPAENISNTSIADPLVWPNQTQTYVVKTTSAEGCATSKEVTVIVVTDVYVPSAFTPNNDRLNDFWNIEGLELYPGCTVTVYDRWGQIVYRSSGYAHPWDGSYKGQPLSTATFVYIINLGTSKKPLSGTVTIIR